MAAQTRENAELTSLIIQRLGQELTLTSTAFVVPLRTELEPNRVYTLEGVLFVDGPQAADLRVRVQATNSPNCEGSFGVPNAFAASNTSSSASTINPNAAAAIAASGGPIVTVGLVAVGTMQVLQLVGGLVTRGGSNMQLELQLSQAVADGSPITVRMGTWMRCSPIG